MANAKEIQDRMKSINDYKCNVHDFFFEIKEI